MSLKDRIEADTKTALKAHETERAGVLRLLTAQLHNREIELRGKGTDAIDDKEVMSVLRKEIKKRREAADLMRKGGREELAEKEEREIMEIEKYLPPLPTEEDVRKTIASLRAEGVEAFPELMKKTLERLESADGALVAKIAKEE